MGNKIDVAGTSATSALQVLQVADPHAQAVASTLSAVLGLGFNVWSYFSDKRNKELFSSDKLVDKVIEKVEASEDFASFVFDLWQKHNLESSKTRRKFLKKFLESELAKGQNHFDNFSQLEFLMQNINLQSLRLLRFFNTEVYKENFVTDDGKYKHPNLRDVADVAEKHKFLIPFQDLEYRMNDLVNNGLVAISHGLWDGPQYNQASLGFLLLEYVSEDID